MVAGIACLCNPFRRRHLRGIKLDDVTDNRQHDQSCNLAPKTRRKSRNQSNRSEQLLPCNQGNDSSVLIPSAFPAGPSLVFSGEGKETTETTSSSEEVMNTKENNVKFASSSEQYKPILPVNIESKILPDTERKRRSLSLSASSSSMQSTGNGRTSRFASLGSSNKSKRLTTYSKRTYNGGKQQDLINTVIKEDQSSQYDITTQPSDTEIPTIRTPNLHSRENQRFSYSPSRRIDTFNDKTIHPNILSNTNGDRTIESSSVPLDMCQIPSVNKQSYEEIQDKIFRPTHFPAAANSCTESVQQKDPGNFVDGEIREKTQLSLSSSQIFHFEDTTIVHNCEVLSTENEGEAIDDFAESSLPSRPGTDHGESKPERPSVCSKSDSIGMDTISTTSHDAIGFMITATNSSVDSNQQHLSKATLAAVAELDDIVRSLKNSIQESNARSPKHRLTLTQSKQSPSRTTFDLNRNSVSPISTSRSIKHVGISPKNSHERNSPEHNGTSSSPLVAKARSCTSFDVNQDSEIGLNQRSSHSRTHDNSRGSEVPNSKRISKKSSPLTNTKQSIAKQNSQEIFLQKNSVTSYVDVLASSWDTEGDSDDEKASLYGDDDETQDKMERTLSSLPDNVDPQVKQRYIAMCQLLKDVLVSNKQVDLQHLEPADREIFSGFVMAKQEHQNVSPILPVLDQTQHVLDAGTGQQGIDFSDHTYGQMSTSLFTAVESVYSAEFYNSSRIPTVPPIDRRHRGTTTERNSHTDKAFEVASNDTVFVGTHPISSSVSRMSDTTPLIFNGRNKTIHSDSSSHNYTMNASTREFSTSSLFTNIEDEKEPFLVLGTDTLVNGDKTILTITAMEEIRGVLPSAHADENFHLKFCSRRDGNSLSTLLHQVQWCKNTIFAIETRNGDVFGAFCSSFWHIQPKWFGSEQSFLWRMTKENVDVSSKIQQNEQVKSSIEIFSWTGSDHYVQHCSTDAISVGGGGRSDLEENKSSKGDNCISSTCVGLFIDGDLMSGETNPCATFGNPSLIREAKHLLNQSKFEIFSIEVWTMTPCMTVENALELEEQRAFVENHGFI